MKDCREATNICLFYWMKEFLENQDWYGEWQFRICVGIYFFLMFLTALWKQKTFQFDFSSEEHQKNANEGKTLKFINLWEKFCSFRHKLYIFIMTQNPFAVRKWRLFRQQPSTTTWNIFSIKFHRQTRHHWNLNIREKKRIPFITIRVAVPCLLCFAVFKTQNDIVGRRLSIHAQRVPAQLSSAVVRNFFFRRSWSVMGNLLKYIWRAFREGWKCSLAS